MNLLYLLLVVFRRCAPDSYVVNDSSDSGYVLFALNVC